MSDREIGDWLRCPFCRGWYRSEWGIWEVDGEDYEFAKHAEPACPAFLGVTYDDQWFTKAERWWDPRVQWARFGMWIDDLDERLEAGDEDAYQTAIWVVGVLVFVGAGLITTATGALLWLVLV